MTIKGGRGIDHTSFSGNGSGISLRDLSSVVIDGTEIDPARPDESDVDTDNNTGAGLVIGVEGISEEAPSVVRGLHTSGNTNGIEVQPCTRFTLRGSYTGNNSLSGVYVADGVSNFGACLGIEPLAASVDLGNGVGPDYGRNVFQAADAGRATAICLNLAPPPGALGLPTWPTILAAGNLFGNIDCAVGGTLTRSATCSGQVDLGGISPDGGAAIDLSNCQ